jgi:tetratricopeptide (TPR) repeat protein
MKNTLEIQDENTDATKELIKKEILELLDNAHAIKDQDIQGAIKKLYVAASKIPNIKKDTAKMSIANQTQDAGESELTYLSKKANILYALGEYEDALLNYDLVQNKLPANCKIDKAQGDCYRKMDEYKKASDKYTEALSKYDNDRSAPKTIKAGILNSLGLVELNLYEDSSKIEHLDKGYSFLKEAIKLSPNNPLYHCNIGNILYSLQKEEEAINSFNKANELIISNKLGDELSAGNLDYIKNTLGAFLQDIKEISDIKLQRNDSVMQKREAKFIEESIAKLGDALSDNVDATKLKITKTNLKTIESNDALKEYYDGFIYKINESYIMAMTVNNGTFVIGGNDDTEKAGILISLIPLVGDAISKGVTSVGDFVKHKEIKNAASNISKLAKGVTEFEAMMQDSIVNTMVIKEVELSNIDPEGYILPHWSSKFKALVAKKGEDINTKLYGNRNETPMQKLGYKDACNLVEKIASGSVFLEGEFAVRVKYNTKVERVANYTTEIIDEEIINCNKKYVQQIEPNKSICDSVSSCCNVFSLATQYDNDILNNPRLLKESLWRYDLSTILNLSNNLNANLISEAIENQNGELLLAGLVSVDFAAE